MHVARTSQGHAAHGSVVINKELISLSGSKPRLLASPSLDPHLTIIDFDFPMSSSTQLPSPLLPQGAAGREISEAIARIRYGSVVVHIQDGVVVQIESTEKRRFRSSLPAGASASQQT